MHSTFAEVPRSHVILLNFTLANLLNNVQIERLSVFVVGSSQVGNCGEKVHMLSKLPLSIDKV